MTSGQPGGTETGQRFPLYAQILLGMLLGLLLGPLLGEKALVLGAMGKIVVQLIKAAATPLLFFAIVQAVLTTEVRGRAALRLLFFATVNACIALAIGLSLSNLLLKGLALYVAVGVFGLLLHVVVTYQAWLVLFARITLRKFWKEAREPVAYALGANSSLATLPITLRALDRLGVPRSASALGACVGTNFNNDGIILYEGMAVLFVAQASGIVVPLTEQLLVAAMCLVAAMGVAGVPEAGFVSLALVLNTVKLPLELLPLLLTVDWIIARRRSAVNVLSDMLLSILIAKGGEELTPPAGRLAP